MKSIFLNLIILFICYPVYAQDLKVIAPATFSEIKYSKAEYSLWEKVLKQYSKINSGEIEYESLSVNDKKLIDSIENSFGPLTQGPGCSWYCGGGPYKITSNSYLKQQGKNTYDPENAHDFDLLTAWIPDSKESVIGKKINFHFKPFAPRVTGISIYNGYMKNIDLWKANARAKSFKFYINNKPTAIFKLEDMSGAQTFNIDPVQSTDKSKDLILTLEIVEVYAGTKYKDLAIAEINFDGLDVHCFAGQTRITMADGSKKEIRNIVLGDKVISFDSLTNTFFETEVRELITALHYNLTELQFDDKQIISTNDHPYFVDGKGWCSVNPAKSNRDYIQEFPVGQLMIGDNVSGFENGMKVTKKLMVITPVKGEQLTYTIRMKRGYCFLANELIVQTEKVVLFDTQKP